MTAARTAGAAAVCKDAFITFFGKANLQKLKKETIIAERKDGGLKMMDFEIVEKALKIVSINRITDERVASRKIIPCRASFNSIWWSVLFNKLRFRL